MVGIPPGGEDHQQHRPRLAVGPGGRLYLAYYDFRAVGDGGFHDVYLMESSDGGQSFSTPRRLTDVSSDATIGPQGKGALANFGQHIGLAAPRDGRPLTAWTDSRRGTEVNAKQEIFAEGMSGSNRCAGLRARLGRLGYRRVRIGMRARRSGRARAPRHRVTRRRYAYCVEEGRKDRRGLLEKGSRRPAPPTTPPGA